MPRRRRPDADSGASAPRRAAGELEQSVLAVLWAADKALSPGEVRDLLGDAGDHGSPGADGSPGAGQTEGTDGAGQTEGTDADSLSYSTVVTILSRLHDKGVLTRYRDGRAYRYAPVADAAGLAARRLSEMLDRQPDRAAVLTRFVADLSDRDEALLRELLGEG